MIGKPGSANSNGGTREPWTLLPVPATRFALIRMHPQAMSARPGPLASSYRSSRHRGSVRRAAATLCFVPRYRSRPRNGLIEGQLKLAAPARSTPKMP
jgi:hypothetical protein